MKQWKVYISDSESGCCQPITVAANTRAEAKRMGNHYIKSWRLQDGKIEDIQEDGKCGTATVKSKSINRVSL